MENIFAQTKLKKGKFKGGLDKKVEGPKLLDYGIIDGQQEFDRVEENCILCQRTRPIFIVESDDMIMRMQERYLPQFLKNLKQDFLNGK